MKGGAVSNHYLAMLANTTSSDVYQASLSHNLRPLKEFEKDWTLPPDLQHHFEYFALPLNAKPGSTGAFSGDVCIPYSEELLREVKVHAKQEKKDDKVVSDVLDKCRRKFVGRLNGDLYQYKCCYCDWHEGTSRGKLRDVEREFLNHIHRPNSSCQEKHFGNIFVFNKR